MNYGTLLEIQEALDKLGIREDFTIRYINGGLTVVDNPTTEEDFGECYEQGYYDGWQDAKEEYGE